MESVRNQKPNGKKALSKGNDEKKANQLLNQFLARWSCQAFKRNLLHPSTAKGAFKPKDRYNKQTANAVLRFQDLTGLSSGPGAQPGIVNRATLQAMDRWLGILEPGCKNPKRRGDPKDDLDIEGVSFARPSQEVGKVIASIFFPTSGIELSMDDERALKAVIHSLVDDLNATRVTFAVVGYADKREPISFNLSLGEDRVRTVRKRLRKLFWERDVWNNSSMVYLGEAERPQIGRTADDLRCFRRADVILTGFDDHSCWRCSPEERREGSTNDRPGCDLLCPKEKKKPDICHADETATNWSIKGTVTGVCKNPGERNNAVSVDPCIMSGDLWISGGPTNKGHFCTVQYSYIAGGGSVGFDIPILCNLPIMKLGWQSFTTKKAISFQDFEGKSFLSSSGLEIGLGVSKTTLIFKETGIKPAPRAKWDFGLTSGGVSCGFSDLLGELWIAGVPRKSK